MKKFLGIMFALVLCILPLNGSVSAASSDCLNIKFGNGDNICLGLTKKGSKNFKISVDKKNLGEDSMVRCYIILPNSYMYPLSSCQGSFSYAGTATKEVTISATYVTDNDDFYSKRLTAKIDFSDGTRASSSNVVNSYSSTSSTNSNNVKLSTNKKPTSINQYMNLTIETDDDYVGKVYLSAKYRSTTTSSWSDISNTSSVYFTDYSDEWEDGYYRMKSSDNGEVTLKNLLKFKKSGYYRIYVEDTEGNKSYLQINVGTSSSSSSTNNNSNDLNITVSPTNPDTYEWIKATIETDDDYVGKVYLSAKYRSTTTSSWSDISNTSSVYFTDYSDEWEDGYYRMKSSDNGEVTLKNLLKFKKSGYYRIYVEDTEGNKSYIQFTVGSASEDDSDTTSNVDGFTSRQLEKVKKVYKEWYNVIGQIQRKYPTLKKDNYWIRLSDNFYEDMKDVINNKKYREFYTYEDFLDGFSEWYRYTMQNI